MRNSYNDRHYAEVKWRNHRASSDTCSFLDKLHGKLQTDARVHTHGVQRRMISVDIFFVFLIFFFFALLLLYET